ncbi:hypothetical protein ACPCG0_07300 [Propionibacteriaceae bacterium Y1923]
MQKHFNDIEWRIRGLALTAATFALGAAGVAAQSGTRFGPISLAGGILFLGLLLWYAFYYVDRYWYHPLLKAAVAEGTQLEKIVARFLPGAGLTAGITARSPQPANAWVRFFGWRRCHKKEVGPEGTAYLMHSDHKLRWFYAVGAYALTAAAVSLQVVAVIDWWPRRA